MSLLADVHRKPVVEWLKAHGCIEDAGAVGGGHGLTLGTCWPMRSGYDSTTLEFYPLERRTGDCGWDAIISHHASGTNPRMSIGTCETLEDVQMVYETIRRIDGYPSAEHG